LEEIMKCIARLSLPIVGCVTLGLAAPLVAQEKRAAPPPEQGGQAKSSTVESPVKEERAAKPEDKLPKTLLSQRKAEGGPRALGQANAYWYAPKGSFHMAGPVGRSIYFLATPERNHWDTNWTFQDDLPVGDRHGWTYREVGFQFFMFFSKYTTADCAWNKYQIMFSHNNVDFSHYACAD
jgi:hypothetical protein